MTDNKMKIALAKFKVGDGLDNNELKELLKFFKNATAHLLILTRQFDGGFRLAYKEADANLQRLESFKYARER